MSFGERVWPTLPLGSPFLSFPVSKGHLAVSSIQGLRREAPVGGGSLVRGGYLLGTSSPATIAEEASGCSRTRPVGSLGDMPGGPPLTTLPHASRGSSINSWGWRHCSLTSTREGSRGALRPITGVLPHAGCAKPLRAPSGSISPSPGNPWTSESLSSPTGASPVPRPPRSQVMEERAPLCPRPLRGSPQPATHPTAGPLLCTRSPKDGHQAPRQHSQPTSVLCLHAASSSFRSSDKPTRTPSSRSMRECPQGSFSTRALPLPRFTTPPANLCPKGPSPPVLW